MATTTIQTIITRARRALNETTARFWSDTELLDLAQMGVEDLWKAVKSVNKKHLLTSTASTLSANATGFTAPDDLADIYGIEPSDPDTNVNLHFKKKDYFSADFQVARFASASDPRELVVYYDVFGPGGNASSSSGSPTTIKTAPKVTSNVGLTLYYVPTISSCSTTSINPIPGASDNALIAWVIAYARAREREDRAPDSEWLAVYATEKQNLVSSVLDPRDKVEDVYVEGMFEGMWPD